MNNDTALILMLADRQRDIEALRQRVSELEQANAELHQALASSTADAQVSGQ